MKPKKHKKKHLNCKKCLQLDKKAGDVIEKKIECEMCEYFFHLSCADLNDNIAATIDCWYCQDCLIEHPNELEIAYKSGKFLLV